jgi:VWFA-related protein
MKKRTQDWRIVFVLLPLLAFAQEADAVAGAGRSLGQAAAAPLTQGPELKIRPAPTPQEGRIQIDVVVTDKSGKPVSGLELKDFTLLDNKVPTKIVSFHAVGTNAQPTDPPAEVILLLDAVNLGYLTLAQTRDEIAKFLRQNGGHLAMPVSVALFTDDGVKILLEPSTDGNALAAELDKARATLRLIGRSGGVNGASEQFNLSTKWLGRIAESEAKEPRRKLLIWAGPGWPLLNQANIKTSPKGVRLLFDQAVDLSTTLREAHVALYSVSLSNPSTDTSPLNSDLYESFLKGVKAADRMDSVDLALKVIAVQSGGQALSPDNDLAAQVKHCVQDANAFYTLSFDPPRTEEADEYHDLKIVIDKPRLTASTNTGYYNQP